MSGSKRNYQALALQCSQRGDQVFTWLLLFQWGLGIVLALAFAPTTWVGTEASIHPHVYAAVFLGSLLALGPIALLRLQPDHWLNSNVVAAAQILFSTLFIHLTGGRIETHFHVFGSLAFLSIYRSRGPVWTATALTFLDHLLRGYYWPESVYGVATSSPFRALEHGAWVLFEVVVILRQIRMSQEEMRSISETQARLEDALALSTKMSALGEFISGVAHEINNPMTVIKSAVEICEQRKKAGELTSEQVDNSIALIKRNTDRAVKIIKSLKNYSRTSASDPMEIVSAQKLAEDIVEICRDSMRSADVNLQLDFEKDLLLECRASEIEQVLMNLIVNARDAIATQEQRWIRVQATRDQDYICITVTDSGSGIAAKVLEKIMTPFFTTKPVGVGTGLGLSISRKVCEAHGGTLSYVSNSPNTCFAVRLPLRQTQASKIKTAS